MFLTNKNMRQLYRLILGVWMSTDAAAYLQKFNSTVLVVDGKAHKLDVINGQVRPSLLVVNLIVKASHYL